MEGSPNSWRKDSLIEGTATERLDSPSDWVHSSAVERSTAVLSFDSPAIEWSPVQFRLRPSIFFIFLEGFFLFVFFSLMLPSLVGVASSLKSGSREIDLCINFDQNTFQTC